MVFAGCTETNSDGSNRKYFVNVVVSVRSHKALATQPPRLEKTMNTQQLNETISKTLSAWNIPGAAVTVVQGHDVFTQGYGAL